MAVKRRKSARSARSGVSAGQAVSSGSELSPRAGGDWVAPSVCGVFFLCLFLAYSTVLESKFVLPKAIVLCAGVLAFGVLLIVRNWRGRAVAPPRSALLLALALGAWWMVSTPFALHLPTALNGEYNRYNGLWTHLCWLGLFVASSSIPSDLTTVRRIAALLAAAVVPVALVNIADATGFTSFGLKELSTLGDRVAASALMNFAIPFVVIALVRVRHWGLKAGLGGLLALVLVSEFLSQGRGPWMGLAVAAVVLAIGLVRAKAGLKAVAAMLLALVMLAGLTAKLSPLAAERFATLTNLSHDESLRQRFVIYQAALHAVREHPIAGIGFDNFRNSYPSYRAAEDAYFFKGVIPTMVHDGYLQAAVTNGIPALLLYLALAAGVLIKLVRELSRERDRDRRDLLLGFLAALSAYLVQDVVGWLDMAVTSAFWVTLGLALNLADQPTPRSSAAWAKPVVAGVAGLMVLLSLYLLNDRYARASADTSLFEAQALDDRMQWPKTEVLVNQALASLPGDSRTEMVAGQIYAMRFVSSHDPAAYARSRELLESSYKHNHFDRLRLINIVGLESLALERGQIGSASDFAQNAIGTLAKTDGDNPDFHELEARFFAAQGRFSEALMAMREARRLAPKEERFRSFEAEYEAELH
jgi:putative inorganic carbon (HCO3(-)) transporter